MPERECGSCRACCWAGAIDYLKDTAEWCPNCDVMGELGCKIYPDRPQQCADFLCAWIRNDLVPEELYPKKSRVLITDLLTNGKWVGFSVTELVPGAAKHKKVIRWIAKMVDLKHRMVVADPRRKLSIEVKRNATR